MKTNKIFLFIIATLLLLNFISANLGTFPKDTCVNIVVPLNATTVTLTNIITPSPNSEIILSNVVMDSSGNFFNYTFCNTSKMGTYTYGYCDDLGNCYGNDFKINGSGQDVSSQQTNLIIMGLIVMIIVCAFFFILSILFKHPGTKIFLMTLSAATLIVVIGLIASNAEVYLAEFPGIVNMYNTYYIVTIGLAAAAMAGIMLWLIYYAFTLFNKMRGRTPDDD